MARVQVSNRRYRFGCGARIRTGAFITGKARHRAAVSVVVCWRRSRGGGGYAAADRNVRCVP